jgi:large subunit ribosomal protein L22
MRTTDAIGLLELDRSPSAFELLRAIRSAVANAENNHDLKASDLVVKEACASDATRMRRLLPRARGRADVVRKRSCHVLVVVSDEQAERKEQGTVRRRGLARSRR